MNPRGRWLSGISLILLSLYSPIWSQRTPVSLGVVWVFFLELLVIRGVRRARYLSRPSRFTVLLSDAEGTRACHLHDPGRLKHLLRRGAEVFYRWAWRPGRRTSCDVVAVRGPGGVLVLEDTRLGNKLFPMAASLLVPGLTGDLAAEKWVNGTRIDFVSVDREGRPVLIEVKSTNLVENGVALFPDAPSTRARRQVEALVAATRSGARAAIVFTVLRGDAHLLRPNRAIDPGLARLLKNHQRSLELYAYRVDSVLVGDEIRISYAGAITIDLD